MTFDQFMGMLRQFLPTIATLLTTLGVISTTQETSFVSVGTIVIGAIGQVAGFIWSLKANSKTSIIASASAMPEVDSNKLATAIVDPELKKTAIENAN